MIFVPLLSSLPPLSLIMKPLISLRSLLACGFYTFLLVTAATLIFGVCSPRAIAAPVLVEFMASNDRSLYDEDGQSSDWIEIFNPDPTSVDISGWFLTNDPDSRWSRISWIACHII